MKNPFLTADMIKALSPLEAEIVQVMQPAGRTDKKTSTYRTDKKASTYRTDKKASKYRIDQKSGKYSAAQIYSQIAPQRKVAHSSISVLLDRLYQRGLVTRETKIARGGIRFIYSLETDKEKYERTIVENTVNLLIRKFGSKAIAYFNESFRGR